MRVLVCLLVVVVGGAWGQYMCAPNSREAIIVSLSGSKFPCTSIGVKSERVTIGTSSNQYFLLGALPGPEMLVIRNGAILDTAQRGGSDDYVVRGNRIDMSAGSGAFGPGGRLIIGDHYRFIYTAQ